MPAKIEFKYEIPEDEVEDSPGVKLFLDADSDVMITQDTATLYVSLPQAYALHRALGQALVRHERSWGNKLPTLTVV